MKRILTIIAAAVTVSGCGLLSGGQLDTSRALSGAAKAVQAATITDAQVMAYTSAYVAKLDASSKISASGSTYSKRLANLTKGLTDVDGIALNFKVYETSSVNAFACADGSVRVYSGLMDLMTDDEVLGVIGHEIGHVALKHSKKGMQSAILTSAVMDGVASTSTTLATLTDSQLGAIGEAVMNARYSKKQENQADDYGYEFLKSKGKNPVSMIKSFEKLQSLQSSSSSSAASYVSKLLSSHPDTATRIARLKKQAVADGYLTSAE